MVIDSKTFYNITEIDNVGIMGDIFLDYPHFNNCSIVSATYQDLPLESEELDLLNADRALVQLICLNYISDLCDLDNIG